MRILHVVPSYLPAWRYGGPIHSVHALARACSALGHEVHVFTTDADGPGRLDVPCGRPVSIDGVQVHYFPLGQPRRLYRAPDLELALRSEIANFDVLHLHSLYLWPTWRAARVARAAGVPYVLSPRGMLVRELVRRRSRMAKLLWLRCIEGRTLREASLLHATSALEAREALAFGLELAPIEIVPNGVSLDWCMSPALHSAQLPRCLPAGVHPGEYLLFLGRVQWKKGLPSLLQALASGRPGLSGRALLIAGPQEHGHQAQLERLALKLGLGAQVHFLGEVQGAFKAQLLAHSRALVLPSIQENFGNVVLESLASGRPVVVCAHVGAAELVERHACGLVVHGAGDELSAALERICLDAELADACGARGRALVAAEYGWGSVAQRMLACYERLLALPLAA